MPLGNVWSFPSRRLTYDDTLRAMRTLAGRISDITAGSNLHGHPIDITWTLEPEYLKAAGQVTAELGLPDPIPKLCVLVTASPFDAPLHDAYGRLHRRNCYGTYGPDFLSRDLSHYLGADFEGEWLERYLRKAAEPLLAKAK